MALDLLELLALATRLARGAGAMLLDRPPHLVAGAKSSPTDAVTEMDRASEQLIVGGLAEARPDDAVLTEESAGRSGGSPVRWVVDPLDGTVNYLYDLPQWAVSIAAEVEGELAVGVVFDPAKDEMYAATAGGGATLNGTPLACTRETHLAMALVATGFAYTATTRGVQARALATVLPRVRDIRRLGSAALDLCAVAAGRVDAYFEAGMHPWDWAAGALIAREAGARVGGLHDRPPGSHTTLAANPALFAALHDLLVEAGADADPAGDPAPTS